MNKIIFCELDVLFLLAFLLVMELNILSSRFESVGVISNSL